MKKLLSVFALAMAVLGLTAIGASAAMMTATATLHPANMHLMAIEHATGSAHITYTSNGHDATIILPTTATSPTHAGNATVMFHGAIQGATVACGAGVAED